jgi:hypothetical protein
MKLRSIADLFHMIRNTKRSTNEVVLVGVEFSRGKINIQTLHRDGKEKKWAEHGQQDENLIFLGFFWFGFCFDQ